MEPLPSQVGLGVTFDSTHYVNGTSLHITITAQDNLGQNYSLNEIVPVKNRAMLGNHSFANPVAPAGSQSHSVVASKLGTKYTWAKKLGSGLTQTAWRNSLGDAQFVYISTHGTPDIYEMENGNPFYDDDPSNPDHRHRLMGSIGSSFTSTTYPPYNPSAVPPPNFVFIDACDVFQQDFSWILYPMLNLYSGLGTPATKNVFTAGWKVKMKANLTEHFAERLMTRLMEGRSCRNGLLRAVQDLADENVTLADSDIVVGASDVGWHGDEFTKIAAVYTGNTDISLDWYR